MESDSRSPKPLRCRRLAPAVPSKPESNLASTRTSLRLRRGHEGGIELTENLVGEDGGLVVGDLVKHGNQPVEGLSEL